MAVVVGIAALAACNALLVPLRLEHQVRGVIGGTIKTQGPQHAVPGQTNHFLQFLAAFSTALLACHAFGR